MTTPTAITIHPNYATIVGQIDDYAARNAALGQYVVAVVDRSATTSEWVCVCGEHETASRDSAYAAALTHPGTHA
jgi:hypothetical protein